MFASDIDQMMLKVLEIVYFKIPFCVSMYLISLFPNKSFVELCYNIVGFNAFVKL